MKSKSRALFEKSLASILASIEIYNKPDFSYREETFSVLTINAWELLLKARIVQCEQNKINSIFASEKKRLKNGEWSKKEYYKRNRAGNALTIGLFKAYDLLVHKYGEAIPAIVGQNIEILTEIRDNSIHFYNSDLNLKRRLLEVGTAALKNYASLSQRWFGADLGKYNFFIMPIGFVRDFHTAEVLNLNIEEQNLLEYISRIQKEANEEASCDFALSLEVNLKIKKKGIGGAEVTISNNPDAVEVRLEEEDLLGKYPWGYDNLKAQLIGRYSNFKQNQEFHILRRSFESDSRYCLERLLDPTNPKSSKKRFYNPNIVREIDKHYQKK